MIILYVKRLFTIMTGLLTLISGYLGNEIDPTAKKVESFRVTSYLVADYIQNPSSVRSEDFDIITDVILFGAADFDTEGNVNLKTEMLETALQNIRNAIGKRDINITLNLLGPTPDEGIPLWEDQMESQSDKHNKAFMNPDFADNIIAVLEKYDFDGVHFDYEYPVSFNAWVYYNLFLIGLDIKLGNEYTLGVAANEWNLYLSTAAVKAVDVFEMMMYDIYDEENKHSPTDTITELLNKVELAGIPLEKVNLGLPFYSRPTDRTTYWYGYNDYLSEIDENGWYYDSDIDKHFWFNTPDVIFEKTEYAIDHGYGGVMIWHYSCDIPSTNEASLLKAVGDAKAAEYK